MPMLRAAGDLGLSQFQYFAVHAPSRLADMTEAEAVAEDESAYESPDQPLVSVPRELVPAVRQLIAKHRK